MRVAILALIFLLGLSPLLGAEPCGSLHALRWLLGEWKTEGGERVTLESWVEVSATTFEGRGETRSAATNELLSSESLRIVEMSGELFYLAKVGHNALPVPFKATACSDSVVVFENAGHDFPRRLEYRRLGEQGISVLVTDGRDQGFRIELSGVSRSSVRNPG